MMRYIVLGIGETLFVSKRRWLTACGWLLIVFLCAGYAFSVVLCPAFALLVRGTVGLRGWWLLLSAGSLVLAAVFFVSCVTIARALVRMGWDHTRRFRHMSVLTLGLLLWILVAHLRRDAANLSGDYTVEDIPSPGAHAAESHALLLAAFSGGGNARRAPCMGDPACTNDTADHIEAVQQAWQDRSATRDLLARLDTFDGIGDRQEPRGTEEGFPVWLPLRDYAQVTWAFCIHSAAQADAKAAARELARFHSVVRKALPYSRSLLRKMILIALANGNLGVVDRLLADERQAGQVAEILRPAFTPLTKEDVSLCGVSVFEYLAVRDLLRDVDLEQCLYLASNGFTRDIPDADPDSGPARFLLSLLYNRNGTLRDLQKHWEQQIRATGEPGSTTPLSAEQDLTWGVWSKNPAGRVLVNRQAIDVDRAMQVAEALRQRSRKVAALLDAG